MSHSRADADAAGGTEPQARPPSPQEDGRACDLCGGRDFTLLHEWPVGDRWNPAKIPIRIWKCTCGLAFMHPVLESHAPSAPPVQDNE